MSRFGKIISELEDLHQQDVKDTARVFSITATLSQRLRELLEDIDIETDNSAVALPSGEPTKDDLIALYGNYNNAYRAYKDAYNLKGVKGWDGLLRSIRDLTPPSPPVDLEKRVEKLEKIVKVFAEILLERAE
ncbi:hypothetical protein V0288_23965 [Pannus brasiliensis CCIBt3594]|uniref:Uncharacterized protein n=1 Tax=Pannus brasiliensis CCIBt3594 TaxID=1427578 RepID=A0AAW9QQZ9_9CHRO